MENFYALLIGVGDDLPVTVKDANSIKKILINKSKGGYLKSNVTCLTEKNCSKARILSELDKLIKISKKKKESTIVVYYSGHGGRYKSKKNEFEYYLKTYGSDEDNRKETMLDGKDFSEKINQLSSQKLLVMLDCCHASGIKERAVQKKSSKAVSKNCRELLKKLKKGKGRIFISSCDDDEESVILPNSNNSLFTEVALEALNGVVDQEEEFVGVVDLIYHILKEVPKRVKEFNHIQRPIINEVIDLSPEYFLCRNGLYKKSKPISPRMLNKKITKGGGLIDKLNKEDGHDDHVTGMVYSPSKGRNLIARQIFNRFGVNNVSQDMEGYLFIEIGGETELSGFEQFTTGIQPLKNNEIENDSLNSLVRLEDNIDLFNKLKFINLYQNKI